MKNKSYEKSFCLSLIVFCLFIMELIFFSFLFHFKFSKYIHLQGSYINHKIVLMINKKERKTLYANSFFYFHGKKKKYQIIEDQGVVFQQNGIDYYEIILDSSLSDYQLNSISISIKNGSFGIVEIIELIMEGG